MNATDLQARHPASAVTPERLARLSGEFNRFATAQPGIRAGVLATADGLEIAAYRPDREFRSQNLAAMASSLTAISRAITREVAFDGCDRLLVESVSGRIVFQPVNALSIPSTICIAVSAETVLGRTLWSLDEFVRHLRSLS